MSLTRSLFTLSSAGIIACALAGISDIAQASCSDTGFCGRIFYLGKTSDKKQAVFLSATKTPGKYDVSTTEAFAPNGGGDKPIDTWSRNRPGLRLTVSDYPQDWGGTHILYSYATDSTPLNERRFVASVNQTPDGIVFPPNFKPPVIKPPRPPVTGITPELPMGVKPPIGTLPPQPPVTGITPELPMGVKPPIAVIPPKPPVTGITPELPMGVKPPIGTLPPQPPVTGITPELPMGVKPPIAVIPPKPPVTGVTPELPMGVKPPIGTLPPQPPVTGVTPELPMGVKPPIGTLPPEPPVTGITPELPIGVKPPIGTLPPETGGELVAQTNLNPARQSGGVVPCVQQQDANRATPSDTTQSINCSGMQLQANPKGTQNQLPPTEGREFNLDSEWNTWADTRYTDISDRRNQMDLNGYSGSVMVGVDRRLDSGLIAGLMVGADRNKSSAFDGDMVIKSHGVNIGAYLAYPYSANWVFDGSLSYGYSSQEQRLVVLNGDFNSNSFSFNANANGQYSWGEAIIRPRMGVSYTHNRTESYDLTGVLGPYHLTLNNAKQSSTLGTVDGALELNRTYILSNGNPIMPYGELSASYEFDRINDGKILSGDLSMVETSPWVGGVKVGVRSLLGRATSIDASIAYNSIGQNDLAIWEYRLYFAHSF